MRYTISNEEKERENTVITIAPDLRLKFFGQNNGMKK